MHASQGHSIPKVIAGATCERQRDITKKRTDCCINHKSGRAGGQVGWLKTAAGGDCAAPESGKRVLWCRNVASIFRRTT